MNARRTTAGSLIGRAGEVARTPTSAPNEVPVSRPGDDSGWLDGDGEVRELIRSRNWSETPLGPIGSWPQNLRATVSLVVGSSYPMSVIWGDGAVQIWNDAYASFCGDKHPGMFGSDYRECWASAWPAIGDAFETARAGHPAFLENQPMFLDRNGYLEETWFTFSLSPIFDEQGDVAGLLLPVTETSARMLSERRIRALRDLSNRIGDARTTPDAIAGVIEALGETGFDVPFALLYLRDDATGTARLRGHTGVEAGAPVSRREIALSGDSPVALALQANVTIMVDDLAARFGPVHAGPHEEGLACAFVVPITPPGEQRPIGAIMLGVSTRLPFDDLYRGFLELVAQSVTSALASANAHEIERARADGLAELDRAKTTFLANISHEFRTPLTLMLGPLEDELAAGRDGSSERYERVSIAHRNAMRLLRLVNSLLEFSRTESGRMRGSFEATDLSAFTAGLADLFRYAIEAAGVTLTVDCEPLAQPIYVDREMWERIVMNLLSNAFKHTFDGEVAVTLRWRDDHAELAVRDTGVGIPAAELPRLFERFHRVRGARSRTIEGTGIGLALSQELARRHGGEVTVESEEGVGSTFTVTVAAGTSHLPANMLHDGPLEAAASGLAVAQAQEATEWLTADTDVVPERQAAPRRNHVHDGPRPRLLLADDNADMRRYVVAMLEPSFEVTTAPDGVRALDAALANPPDLVLTDVMMPRLDGFGLVAAMREDDRTRTIPVIMLTARAGEDSLVDGIRAGVDDYVVKPFSTPELIARIWRSLELSKVRREAEQHLKATNGELVRALDQLELIARTDPGTGLPNRRAWDEELGREIARARRKGHPLCLALLDLDHLKAYNDTYGHQAGDALLRDAGTAWRLALRVTDFVARIGGDEFGLLMPDCPLEEAQEVLERVRAATPGNETCSTGLACWDATETPEALVARADLALYAAKRVRPGAAERAASNG